MDPQYIHQQQDWPKFHWNSEEITELLLLIRHRQGRILGSMEGLGFSLRTEASLQSLTEDVVKTSQIEGEKLDPLNVRSSIARRLGIDIGALRPADRNIEGVVDMMLDATQNYQEDLKAERLFKWHAGLFPNTIGKTRKLKVGKWRDDHLGPMQVVSGTVGREKVHFEAPAASRLHNEMQIFLKWFNKNTTDPVLKSGIAHFWFITLHPFDDGNGRIARAIADLLLARSEKSPQRFYSMSAQISADRNSYYNILESSQRGSLDITRWLKWYLTALNRAFNLAEITLSGALKKAAFWKKFGELPLNDRQKRILNRLLDGFEGKLTSAKWATLGKCSQDTASRDIEDLIRFGILIKGPAGGRSTSYFITHF